MPSTRTALALCALSAVASTVLADPSSEYVVTAPIARRSAPKRHALYERDTQTVALKNDVNNLQYTMNVTVGTPPQPITLQLDTGSTDVWVVTPQACQVALNDRQTQGNLSNCGGSYDITKSTTGKMIPGGEGQFHATYQDGTGAQAGDYITDTLGIGQWSLPGYTIGQATQVDTIPGLIGVGFDLLEANVSQPGSSTDDIFGSSTGEDSETAQPYPAVLSSLLDAGHIRVRSFSLWLDDLDESTGTIMFGGFDTAKIGGGKLQMLPMQNDSDTGVVDRYQIALTSVGVTVPGSNGGTTSTVLTPNDYVVAATLDSGTSLTEIPNQALTMIANAMGAQMDTLAQGYVADCSLALTPGSLNFQFGGSSGPVVGVPFSELIIPLVDPVTGQDIKGTSGKGLCQLGLIGVDDATASFEGLVLGDTFLRSAYVYYNLDSLSIGVAQTVFDTTQQNIQEVSNNRTLPEAATSIASTVTIPTPSVTPQISSSAEPQGYVTQTGITAKPATTFNAAMITGQSTSYSVSLPTAAGTPSPRVSAEAKGTPVVGDTPAAGAPSVRVGVAGTLVGAAAAFVAGLLL